MARLLLALLTLAQIGCKDTTQNGHNIKAGKVDIASIENIIHQVRQQTLDYLDTMVNNDSKTLVRFHSKLDSSTYQTLRNWISHNETKIQSGDKEILNLLNKSYVDSLLLIKYDTTLLTSASNADKIIQIHFNGFVLNSDTTKIATVIGVYLGDEDEMITGWKEFLVFSRQGNRYIISKKDIVTEY
ncbi:MAG TPA: hypothetical protein VFW07_19015 [Parafilimonas sp.]|nr:hypothetical protein [Parafilimonas sp.]